LLHSRVYGNHYVKALEKEDKNHGVRYASGVPETGSLGTSHA
jgi:hypothetical protein